MHGQLSNVIVGLFVTIAGTLIALVLYKTFGNMRKINILYKPGSYRYCAYTLGQPSNPQLSLELINKSSTKRFVLITEFYYEYTYSNEPQEGKLSMIMEGGNQIGLETNSPYTVVLSVEPEQLKSLTNIYIKDTTNKRWDIEKDSLKQIKNDASKLLKKD